MTNKLTTETSIAPPQAGSHSFRHHLWRTLRSGEPLGSQRRERFRSPILPLRLNLHRAVSNLPWGRYTSIGWPSICIKRSRIQYRRPDDLPPQPCWHIPSTKHAEHVSNAKVVVKLVLHLLLRLLWRYLRSHPWMRGVLYRGNHSHVLVTVMLAEQRFWIVVCAWYQCVKLIFFITRPCLRQASLLHRR